MKTSERIKKAAVRFLIPMHFLSVYYMLRHRVKISPRSEVDFTPNLKLGEGTTVSSFTKIKALDGLLKVGRRSGFATGCFVSTGEGEIHIGENFICGPNVNIIGRNYSYHEKDVHLEDKGSTSLGIRIGDNVWIGAGSTILDGSSIGDNTVVVAGSLINRKYPPNVILQGSPAKIILRR